MIQIMGNTPKAAPSVATASEVPNGMPQPITAIRIATTSAIAPAMWARTFSPASRTNSVASGIIATSALRNSESPIGSSTCLYIVPPAVKAVRDLPARREMMRAVEHRGHGGREVEARDPGAHRDADARVGVSLELVAEAVAL